MSEDRSKRKQRIRNHILKDIKKKKHPVSFRKNTEEDEGERKYRRYNDLKEIGLEE